MHHTLLRTRQFEREICLVERVERCTDMLKSIAAVFVPLLSGIAQDIKLYVEQFFKLQSFLCLLYVTQRLWIMDLLQRLFAGDEMQSRYLTGQQRFRDRALGDACHKGFRHLLDGARRKPPVLHRLRGDIIRLHAHGGELHVSRFLHVGMGKLITAVVRLRLTKDDIFRSWLVTVVHPVLGTEPHEVDDVAAVGEVGDDTFLAAFTKLLEALYGSFDLHERHVARKLPDGVDLRPVHIFIRVILEQVTPSPDVELTDENLLALRSHAGEIHDVLIEYAAHYYLQ